MTYAEADRMRAFVVARLREERERQDLSLKRLGEASGVSRNGIGMIERNLRSPSLVVCLRVADALGVSLADLLKEAERCNRSANGA